MVTYRDALDYLVGTGSRGVKAGLSRTLALLAELGDPQRGLRGVLVAGTNGKGSVSAMTESACRAAGLRTVLLVKPHLQSYRERIVIDGSPITDAEFAALVERVRPAAEALERRGEGAPTQFEILTALGILAAADHHPDVLVCEVGLGGRLDSTNVLDLGVAVITSIALDHRQFLGDTIAEIAAEKAGIIKPGNDVVTGAGGDALDVVRRRAQEVGASTMAALRAEISVEGSSAGLAGVKVRAGLEGQVVEAAVPLCGDFQIENAALAIAACQVLRRQGLSIPDAAIGRGLATVSWRGRLQWVPGSPPLLVDGAHNPAAVTAIAPAVREIAGERPVVAMVGVMEDKDAAAMLDALRELTTSPVFTQPGTPRAARAVDLARYWGPGARAIGSLPDALGAARTLAGAEGMVLVCGSLYLAGDVLRLVAGDGTD